MTRSSFVEIRNAFQCFFKASQIHYFKNARKPPEFTCFFNTSSHVTEHFLHMSNEIIKFLMKVLKSLRKHNDSPNRACLYGVLATNLLTHWGVNVWPRGEDVVVVSQTAVPLTLSIRHFSESCCGCSETHNYVLRNLCSDPWVAHFCHTSLLIFTFSNCVIWLRPL